MENLDGENRRFLEILAVGERGTTRVHMTLNFVNTAGGISFTCRPLTTTTAPAGT